MELGRIAAKGLAGKSWGERTLDLLLPPVCLSCGARVERQGTLCAACWQGLHFLSPPHCACCAFPFTYDLGPVALCAACTARPPAYDRARAAIAYEDASRSLVTHFKYGDRLEGAVLFARLLARAGEGLLRDADFIVPVPLHPFRLIKRRFNQAAILARQLSSETGVPVRTDVLRRIRRTPPQVGLSPVGRRRNVAHAFAVHPRHALVLRGARVVLVDDVLTTGATVEACAKVLRRAGVQRLDVLTLARVVAERTIPI
jgi:ComF family protein